MTGFPQGGWGGLPADDDDYTTLNKPFFCPNNGEYLKLRDELISESTRHYLPGYHIAIANMALGEREEVFAALEKDITERGPQCSTFAIDPLLADLRDDPRFADLLQKVASAKID